MNFAKEGSDYILFIDNGIILEQGTPTQKQKRDCLIKQKSNKR